MNKTIIENPFAFGGTVKGRQFIDREEERAELIQDIENHANLVLYAPRRYGKSSLILQVFEDIKKTNTKFIGLYIDFLKSIPVKNFFKFYQMNTVKTLVGVLIKSFHFSNR